MFRYYFFVFDKGAYGNVVSLPGECRDVNGKKVEQGNHIPKKYVMFINIVINQLWHKQCDIQLDSFIDLHYNSQIDCDNLIGYNTGTILFLSITRSYFSRKQSI